ncbi:HNH endonuclease [Gordonia terrae]|uniref:HNH endonuclease n=1 Tax=Gordonia terrae TaxID=2055 RepID=UPI00200A467F|nr:HNH endonuclease signature motif containing protein [Gordonia terrae]UPW09799.1 HNH endonuclease [Gordonia terrae]
MSATPQCHKGHDKKQRPSGRWVCDVCQRARVATSHYRAGKNANRRARYRDDPIERERQLSATRDYLRNRRANDEDYRSRKKALKVKRKKQIAGRENEPINESAVFERDHWLCGLCGGEVLPEWEYPHPGSASLDHIVPLSKGGSHTYDNVQLAHLKCNLRKGARCTVAHDEPSMGRVIAPGRL